MLNLSRIQVANCLALSAALQMQYCPVQAADSAFDQTFSSGISAMQQGKLSQAEKFLKDSLKLEDKDGASEIKRAQSTMVLLTSISLKNVFQNQSLFTSS